MSLRGDKYETAEEVKFRLENTVVLYDGKPVYINRVSVPGPEDIDEVARVFFKELPFDLKDREKEVRKYLSSKKFDLAPFRMGYMNHPNGVFFVSRTPLRQNRQGLSAGVVKLFDVKGEKSNWVSFSDMISCQGFSDMVNNVYPDFKQAGEVVGDGKTDSVAISQSFAFAVDKDLDALILHHKGVKCGLAFPGDKSIRVAKKFHFLKEELESYRIPIS